MKDSTYQRSFYALRNVVSSRFVVRSSFKVVAFSRKAEGNRDFVAVWKPRPRARLLASDSGRRGDA